MSNFAIDWQGALWAALCGVLLFFIKKYSDRFSKPFLLFSSISSFNPSPTTFKIRFSQKVSYLDFAVMGLLLLALLNPRYFTLRKESEFKPIPTEGIAIYLLIDQSGSMKESVEARLADGSLRILPNIDLAKQVTQDFILGNPKEHLVGRSNDLIGLISLARTAHILAPLTLDHQAVDQALQKVEVVTKQDDDGTAIGYAIYKTVNLIEATKYFSEELQHKGEPAYTIKNSIIIVVTDGLQAPSPLDKGKRLRNIDLPEAADYAKKAGVKIYIINVDPSITSSDLAPQRHQMQQITQETGGGFYIASGGTRLADVYNQINKIEKSTLPTLPEDLLKNISKDQLPQFYEKHGIFPYLIALAGVLLFVSILLKTLYLRRVP